MIAKATDEMKPLKVGDQIRVHFSPSSKPEAQAKDLQRRPSLALQSSMNLLIAQNTL